MARPSDSPANGGGKQSQRHWTIHDIAAEMGVSAKTVSRVINDAPGVGEVTRQRIRAFINDVSYHPHVGARTMRSAPTNSIGVMVPTPMSEVPLSQSFFIWLFQELYRVFSSKGYYVCLDLNPYTENLSADYARSLWEQRVGAAVVLGPIRTGDKTIRRIHASGAPYVAYGRLDEFPESHYATVDYDMGAYISTKHLIERGHRRIAMLKAFEGFQPGIERRRGYLRALEEAGIAVDESLIRATTFASPQIAHSVHNLLIDRTVTALVDCSAAEDAQSVREGARRAGRKLGEDIETVVWTYTNNATVLNEACAHVWLPVREAALEGLEKLARGIESKKYEPIQILFPPTLYEATGEVQVPKPIPLFSPHD